MKTGTVAAAAIFILQLSARVFAAETRVVVLANDLLESASILANHVALQGLPYNIDDDAEAEMWRRLGPRSEAVALIGDKDYFASALHVHRAKRGDVPGSRGRPLWLGPYGSNKDLWLDTKDFDQYLKHIKARLNLHGEKIFFALGSTPKVLSANPSSDQHMNMSPRNYGEWEAVVEAAVRYAARVGYSTPVIFSSGEPESYFLGKDRPRENRKQIAYDLAEMFVHSFRAVERANPKAKLVGTGHVTYSGRLTGEIQGNPEQFGVEDFLRDVRQIDPKLRMKGFAVQGYFWRGLDGYGKDRLVTGARHIADQLAAHGHPRDIPQYLVGWNPVVYQDAFDESKFFRPEVTGFHRDVVDKLGTLIVSEAIRFANPGGEKLIDTAFFYTWNGDGTPGCQGGFTRGNLVSTVHEGGKTGNDGTFTYEDCYMLASDVACTRVPFEAMMFLREAGQGRFARVGNAKEFEDLKIVAVSDKRKIKVLVAHVDAKPLSGLEVEVRGLPPNGTYVPRFRTLKSDERLCAVPTEKRGAALKASSEGVLRFSFRGKESLFLCVLE